jgi:cyclin G-associated kinase
MNKGEVDVTYITSRLIVMSCPTEGIESAAFGNNIDQIREAIEAKHGKAYRIYNLANRVYKKEKFGQVIDLGMQLAPNRAPPISLMCKLCANVLKFLGESERNVCIINCNDGRAISAIAVCTLFMYCNLIRSIDSCLSFFVAKRGAVSLTSVQYNYLKDTQRLFASSRNELNGVFVTSPNECLLTSILFSGCPLFNRQR